jgi:hypothetical protein
MVSVCGFTIQYSEDVALGVVPPLVNQIAFRFLSTHHFEGEVGAEPETVLPALIGGRKQQEKIGFTELSRPIEHVLSFLFQQKGGRESRCSRHGAPRKKGYHSQAQYAWRSCQFDTGPES